VRYQIDIPGHGPMTGSYPDDIACWASIRESGLVDDLRTVTVTPLHDVLPDESQDHQEPEPAHQKSLYQDKHGEYWLDPGDGLLRALDDSLCRRIADAWPGQEPGAVIAEFGPLIPLIPAPSPEVEWGVQYEFIHQHLRYGRSEPQFLPRENRAAAEAALADFASADGEEPKWKAQLVWRTPGRHHGAWRDDEPPVVPA
jgi:hypothetical protein